MSNATRNINAASSAINAAVRSAGPTLAVHELVGGILAIAATTPGWGPAESDKTALGIMIDLVRMVGKRRARELVDVVASMGADEHE